MRYAVARLRSAWRSSRANVRSSTSRPLSPAHARMTPSSRSSLRSPLAPHQVGRHQRARVDHRVVRTVVSLVEHDRVERVATGLDADPSKDILPPVVGQRERIGEHLGDRLKRERPVMVTLAVQLAVDRCQADREGVALLARLVGRVVAALGVIEAIQTSRIDDTMAFEQLPEAGPDPRTDLDARHRWRKLHRRRWAFARSDHRRVPDGHSAASQALASSSPATRQRLALVEMHGTWAVAAIPG